MQKLLTALLSLALVSVACFANAAAPAKAATAIQALATYPAAVRQATVDVLAYPGTLVQLAQTGAKIRGQFQSLIKSYPEAAQKELWHLVRYPRLLRQLTAFGPQDEKSVKATVAPYPKEVQDPVLDLAKNDFDLLQKTADLHRQALQEFAQAMQSLPVEAQNSFRTVGQHSEILHMLARGLQLNTITPESFKKNPVPLTQQAKALAQQIQATPVQTNPVNIQSGSQDDPQAVAALRKAATEFQQQNDYAFDEEPYSKNAVQANVGYTPYNSVFTPVGWAYPYWFGWPTWDPYPYR